MRVGIGRRQFLTGAAAAAAALAVGCSSDSEGAARATGAGTSSTTVALPATSSVPDLATDPFTLGVASGDPLADRVILWTRLAPEPLADDGGGGMAADPVEVVWQVATDESFETLVAAGVAVAEAAFGHSVHVDATGLEPGTEYRYRFTVGDHTSPIGRTRTLASGSPERFGLAVVNCQMLEGGQYGAYRNLVDEDVDVVLHLGDYIYEYPGGTADRAAAPARALATVDDYRLRYAAYKVDEHLRAAHARFPFVATWDDHEVANNYADDLLPGNPDPEAGRALKAAAYQAWWEHLPVRLDPPDGSSDLAVFRALTVGDLARVHVLDERQDADQPPCRPDEGMPVDFGDCEERLGEDRSRLGEAQEAWLEDSLAEGGVTWNLLGNPVVLAGVDAGRDAEAFYLDTWDGYPQARERLIAQLGASSNPVVLTGDYHAGMVLDVHERPFDQTSAVAAPEFMAPPISSPLFADDISPRTPQLRQQLNHHGYLTVEVTPDELTARFRVLDDVADAGSAISTAATWTVAPGDPVARRA